MLTSEKVAWFASNAISLHPIDPKDRDFSDLRPLQQAIGNARVVLLGGDDDEAVVKLRYRLVRFLHEEMGFDVLACGLPLFDAEEFDRALDLGKAPRADLQELNERAFEYYSRRYGMYSSIGMLNYARGTHKNGRPLHIAGLWWGVSAYGVSDYTKRLFQFLDGIHPQLASPADRKAIQGLLDLSGPAQRAPVAFQRRRVVVDRGQWEKKLGPGVAAVEKLYAGLGLLAEGVPEDSEIVFFRQTLANLANWAAATTGRPLAMPAPDMAATLAKVFRPESKIVLWTTNVGAARNASPPARPNGGRVPPRSPGNEFARLFGVGAYSIAFREIRNDNELLQVLEAGPQPKLAPVDGDLESLLHAAGKPYSFVDFRSVPAHHWLRAPLSARLINAAETAVWPDRYDGLITIDIPAAKERK